jgi:crossover junction endodeoxyribonuclease RusA
MTSLVAPEAGAPADPESADPSLTDHAARIVAACEHRNLDERDHTARHLGEPCPYAVAAAILLDEPDPRDLVEEWRVDISGILIKGLAPLTLNRYPTNHFAKNKTIHTLKARVRNAIRNNEVPHLARVQVQLHFQPARNNVRDIDNLVATLKPAIDALHQPDKLDSADLDADRKWQPILDGDDPRYVTWIPPVLHPAVKGQPAKMWLILRSYPDPQPPL